MNVIYVDDERSAHANFHYGIKDRTDIQNANFFFRGEEAFDFMKGHHVDCVFLDINLGGVENGLELVKVMKQIQSHIEVVFVTGYDDYAREAFRVGGRGYLTKPYTQEELDDVLNMLNLMQRVHHRNEEIANRPQNEVTMKTFGNFDMLIDRRPVPFKNAKAKELLAFLVHQRGGSVSSVQIFLALWEQQKYTSVTSTYVRRTVRALKEELEGFNMDDILLCKRNCYSVDITRFTSDYYSLIEGDLVAIDSYCGEYMNQYSWGESTIPFIERKIATCG